MFEQLAVADRFHFAYDGVSCARNVYQKVTPRVWNGHVFNCFTIDKRRGEFVRGFARPDDPVRVITSWSKR